MRIPNHLQSGEVGFNMTPMIDVVFLLIIFFLVSSHLAKQETHMELDLPSADSGEKPLGDASPRLTINVLSDGSLSMTGRSLLVAELPARLKARRQASRQSIEVRIRCDRAVPYALVEPVMLACQRADVWDVAFSVYRKEDLR